MIRGFYNSVSSLITLQNEQETITNNIANINNNGYKKRMLTKQSFDDVMISNRQKLNGDKYVRTNIGTMNLGVNTADVETIFTQGSLRITDKMTDFAIEGRGFFVARTADGQEVYTRDGNFKINQAGYLITNDGCSVLGQNNVTGAREPIYVGSMNFSVDGENNINIEGVGPTHKLMTVDFQDEDYKTLAPLGDNYVTTANPIYNARVGIIQNGLESSNVNATEEMTKLIEVKRQFETNQKFVKMQDETVQKAASEIGRV